MVCQQCSKHSLVNPFNPKDDRQKRKEEDRHGEEAHLAEEKRKEEGLLAQTEFVYNKKEALFW